MVVKVHKIYLLGIIQFYGLVGSDESIYSAGSNDVILAKTGNVFAGDNVDDDINVSHHVVVVDESYT